MDNWPSACQRRCFVQQDAMFKSILICSAVWLASLSISARAQAQASGDWTACMNQGEASPDVIIGGCNNVIQSGEETSKLAEAYCSRGIAYAKKREYDRAIADYDKAIDLNPKNAKAYYQRGYVYDIKGERDRAMADYKKAMGLLSKKF